jgi:hypothetical protein
MLFEWIMTQLAREGEWLSRNATISFAFAREQITLTSEPSDDWGINLVNV